MNNVSSDVKAKWHQLWSMRYIIATMAVTAAAGAWEALPRDLRPMLPEWSRVVIAAVGVAIPTVAAVARGLEHRQGK